MTYQCAVCLEHHEQILMLACSHDVCISCAAHHFKQSTKIQADFQLKKSFQNLYSCQICYQTTKLQSSTLEEIKQFGKGRVGRSRGKDINRKSRSHKKIHNMGNKGSPFHLKMSKQSQSPKLSSTSSSEHLQLLKFIQGEQLKSSKVKSRQKYFYKTQQKTPSKYDIPPRYDLCERHGDQIKNYYCFQCDKSICAECAIHGEHFGHEVEAVKKAGEKLRGSYQEFLHATQKYGALVASLGKQVQTTMESVTQWNSRQKHVLQERFKELHEALFEKEQKLLGELDEQQRTSLTQLTSEQEQIQRLHLNFKEKRRSMKQSLARDASNWNFFDLTTQKQDIQRLGHKITEMAHRDRPSHQIVYLNCDLVEEAIEGIQQLVDSFRLNLRNKELQGTATFEIMC